MQRKPKLVKFSIEDVRSWHPCYDPSRYAANAWTGTVVDVLRHKKIPAYDKLWLVLRKELLEASLLRRFAIAQAKTCLERVKNKKEFDRILQVSLRFSSGKVSKAELDAARHTAWSAAGFAAKSAAGCAAESAAWYAAESAAWDAAVKMLLKMIREFYSLKGGYEKVKRQP